MESRGLGAAAMGIGVTAMVLVLALWLGATIYTEIPLTEGTVTNESFTVNATSDTWTQLAHSGIVGDTQTVRNTTLIAATNVTHYLMNYTDGTIIATNTTTLVASTTAYIAYTYEYRMSAQSETFTHMNTGITLLAVGLIVAAAMVILGIVLKIAGRGGGRDSW